VVLSIWGNENGQGPAGGGAPPRST
jgi:hypothetical protein